MRSLTIFHHELISGKFDQEVLECGSCEAVTELEFVQKESGLRSRTTSLLAFLRGKLNNNEGAFAASPKSKYIPVILQLTRWWKREAGELEIQHVPIIRNINGYTWLLSELPEFVRETHPSRLAPRESIVKDSKLVNSRLPTEPWSSSIPPTFEDLRLEQQDGGQHAGAAGVSSEGPEDSGDTTVARNMEQERTTAEKAHINAAGLRPRSYP